MLRLVPVTLNDIGILTALIYANEPKETVTLIAGLSQLAQYLHSQKEGTVVRMVMTHDLHNQMLEVINNPFLPVDAARLGIPEDSYLSMVVRIPFIRENLSLPELMDPAYAHSDMGTTPKNGKTYLN